jgi:hypothetical protein
MSHQGFIVMRAVVVPIDDAIDDATMGAIDAAIERAIDRVLEDSFFAKPKQVCALLGISISTYNRAVRARLIETTPRGDYEAVSRPVLRPLLKYGFPSMTGKSAA